MQGAWSAIANAPAGRDRLQLGIESAVRGGRDADTVGAIASSMLGGAYGIAAVPAEWRQVLSGWPGLRSPDLVKLAKAIIHGRAADQFDDLS